MQTKEDIVWTRKLLNIAKAAKQWRDARKAILLVPPGERGEVLLGQLNIAEWNLAAKVAEYLEDEVPQYPYGTTEIGLSPGQEG